MIITTRLRHFLMALSALSLLAVTASRACDDEPDHDRRGVMIGFNVGGANATVNFTRLGAEVEREIEGGHGGALRLGYALSDQFMLSLEAAYIEKQDAATDLEAGAALVVATWYPGGGGFFLRAGVGTGMTTLKMTTPERIDWFEREGDAGLFGLGYEWRLGRQFALGIAVDGVVTEHSDTLGFQDTEFGFGSASLQLNWYL